MHPFVLRQLREAMAEDEVRRAMQGEYLSGARLDAAGAAGGASGAACGARAGTGAACGAAQRQAERER